MFKGETVLTGAKHPGTEIEIFPRWVYEDEMKQNPWYYLGFRDENGAPYSRETDYMSLEEAEMMLRLIRTTRITPNDY